MTYVQGGLRLLHPPELKIINYYKVIFKKKSNFVLANNYIEFFMNPLSIK